MTKIFIQILMLLAIRILLLQQVDFVFSCTCFWYKHGLKYDVYIVFKTYLTWKLSVIDDYFNS